MRKFLIFFELIISVSIFTMENQLLNNFSKDFPKNKVVPLGIKNVPTNQFAGICDFSSKLQVITAGLHAMCPGNLSDNLEARDGNRLLLDVIQRYRSDQNKKNDEIFEFTFEEKQAKDINIFNDWSQECSTLFWNGLEDTVIRDYLIFDFEKKGTLKNYLEHKFKNKPLDVAKKPPIIIINLYSNTIKHLREIETRKQLKELQIPEIPIIFSAAIRNDKSEMTTSFQNYGLIGAVQRHKYQLKKDKFGFLQTILDGFYLAVLPSSFIISIINPLWHNHYDAYVKYYNNWYVLDDETRWKISATQTNSDIVGKALTKCYPGVPCVAVYAPTLSEGTQKVSTNDSPLIHLRRDTKEPSRRKSVAVLLSATLIDGLCAFALLYKLNPDDILCAVTMGLFFGLTSAAYHACHIIPKHYSKITYDAKDRGKYLGPRERIFFS